MIYTIDASQKRLGRIASQAATLLMGKNTSSFKRNAVTAVQVKIVNASKANIDEKKKDQKLYRRYSGYPGGLKTENLRIAAGKRGYSHLFRDAVYGMLPTNKLRPRMMKNLIITE